MTKTTNKLERVDDLNQLKALTPARIGLTRVGSSISTRDMLDFDLDHARARDAVHLPFDVASIESGLAERNIESIRVQSAAVDRTMYLQRPDFGRTLNGASTTRLQQFRAQNHGEYDLAIVIGDGLSARAIHTNAMLLLDAFQPHVSAHGWRCTPIVVALQSRVTLADEVGEILKARLSIILIGERPGLTSADSMGIYLTYAPHIGRTDAQRNCISNIRPAGLTPEQAAHQLQMLIAAAFKRGLSGVNLKIDTGTVPTSLSGH